MLVTFLTLLFAKRICDFLGQTVLLMMTRLFGFLLIVLAAQMVLEGLGEVFPRWLGSTSPIEQEVRKARNNEPESDKL